MCNIANSFGQILLIPYIPMVCTSDRKKFSTPFSRVLCSLYSFLDLFPTLDPLNFTYSGQRSLLSQAYQVKALNSLLNNIETVSFTTVPDVNDSWLEFIEFKELLLYKILLKWYLMHLSIFNIIFFVKFEAILEGKKW